MSAHYLLLLAYVRTFECVPRTEHQKIVIRNCDLQGKAVQSPSSAAASS